MTKHVAPSSDDSPVSGVLPVVCGLFRQERAGGSSPDRPGAHPGPAPGGPHPLQQRGPGPSAGLLSQRPDTGCTGGTQPGGGAVDQRQTGAAPSNPL